MSLSRIKTLLRSANAVILGKEPELRLALACILARGHLLVEDVPGVGKTTLAHVLARLLDLPLQRIQFTSDLLPADVVGVSIFDRQTQSFSFRPGPIFSPFILADEINRATPKTQSALLEAMEERQITVDGATHPLPDPFFVIATQNPSTQIGTFPLPESQLDRFLLRLHLGHPDREAERALLAGEDRRSMLAIVDPVLSAADLCALQQEVRQVHAAPPLIDYLLALLAASRSGPYAPGLSPRAGLALLAAARAWAFMEGRDMVIPEDVQAVFAPVAGHRLRHASEGHFPAPSALRSMLEAVPVP